MLVTGQVQVVEGIAVHHGGADIRQHTADFVLARQGQIGVIGGYQTLLRQDAAVVGLTLGHRVAGGHDLVLTDVDHGVHLHQLGGVLQRHEVGGLVGDIQQQGEGGRVLHLLYLTLGAVHGGVLLGAGHQIEPRLLGALVGENEANVGLVGHHGGDTGVHIHVVTDGDVVVALGGDGHVPLTEQGVDKAVDIRAVVVVLLHDQLGGVDVIHPVGHVAGLVVGALAGDGVHQHGTDDITAAEQADGVADPGADPPGVAVLVDLKGRLVEHIGGVVEAQMAVQVAAEVLGGGVVDALVQTDDLHVLSHHVDKQIGGQAVGAVVQPLDDIAVAQGRDADRAALVVDLGIVIGHLELGDHVRQLAQLAVAQLCGGVGIQHGDLVIADLLHLRGKVAVGNGQQVAVVPGTEQLPADHRAHQCRGDQRGGRDEGHGALLFQKGEVALGTGALKTGGQYGAAAVHGAHQQHEDIEILTL